MFDSLLYCLQATALQQVYFSIFSCVHIYMAYITCCLLCAVNKTLMFIACFILLFILLISLCYPNPHLYLLISPSRMIIKISFLLLCLYANKIPVLLCAVSLKSHTAAVDFTDQQTFNQREKDVICEVCSKMSEFQVVQIHCRGCLVLAKGLFLY